MSNTVDLVLTNSPTLISWIKVIPGLSNHKIVYFEYKVKLDFRETVSQPILLYGWANWEKMKEEMTELVPAFVLLRADYGSSLLSGCPQYLLNKLQKGQNNAARLVLRLPKTDHISHLVSLHWLPIDSWFIQYKHAFLCYSCLNLTTLVCLIELLTVYTPTHQLRSSSDTSILCLPSVCMHLLG